MIIHLHIFLLRNEATLFLPIFLGSLGILLIYFLDSGSNPESGPNSPPTVNNSQASPTAGSNTAIQEVSFNNTILLGVKKSSWRFFNTI